MVELPLYFVRYVPGYMKSQPHFQLTRYATRYHLNEQNGDDRDGNHSRSFSIFFYL